MVWGGWGVRLGLQILGKLAVGKSTIWRTIVGKMSIIRKIIRQINMVSRVLHLTSHSLAPSFIFG